MFVITDKGQVFVFKIIEHAPDRHEMILTKSRPQFTGELLTNEPILVKDLPAVSQIATGVDHFLALDKNGQVFAMGDDTFG